MSSTPWSSEEEEEEGLYLRIETRKRAARWQWHAHLARLALLFALASIQGEGVVASPALSGEEILCEDYEDAEDGRQLERCLMGAAGLLEQYYTSRQRVAVVLSSSECGIDRASIYGGNEQEQNRHLIYISGLALQPRPDHVEERMQSEHESIAEHAARAALLRSVARLVAGGNSDVHLVQLALLRAIWQHGEYQAGASPSVVRGGVEGKCYIHGYSCLPDLTDDDLDFAVHDVGCEILTRPRGLGLLSTIGFVGHGRYQGFHLTASRATLFFPPHFNEIEIYWQTWQVGLYMVCCNV